MSMLATSGRVIWSFALEGGIPFSRQLSKINRQHHVPIRAMVVSVIIQCLIVLIYIVRGLYDFGNGFEANPELLP